MVNLKMQFLVFRFCIFKRNFSIAAVFSLLSLLICSCNLFNAPVDRDYWQKIDEEIAWANAPKLTLRLAYHGNWGSSNPVRGPISELAGGGIDIRSGYDFSIEFIPAPAYSLMEWRVYATAELPEGWEDDTGLLDPDKQLDGAELPPVNPNGGNFTFKLNTTTPASLIPLCVTQPRVIRTEPRDDPDSRYSRATPITIYFNAQMDPDTILFAEDLIEIKDDKGIDLTEHFTDPVYTEFGGFYFAEIQPNGEKLPPDNTEIRVYAGKNIKNIQGNVMADNAMSFSFKTRESSNNDSKINSWSAEYKEDARAGWIEVNVSISGGSMEAVYSENRIGPNAMTDGRISGPLNAVISTGKPNADNLRQGIETSGIREYEISVRVFEGQSPADALTFRIWNVPGMAVSSEQKAGSSAVINEQLENSNEQIKELLEDEAISSIVLTSNITLSDWNPVNFSGKIFFGNGHTVTIKSFNPAYTGEDYGLFGVVGTGAVIRDLTIIYEDAGGAVSVSPANEERFGGIAGTVSGGACFENVLVKGAVTVDGTGEVFAGGMVGHITSTATNPKAAINNAYSGLSLSVNRCGFIGGAVGAIGSLTVDTNAVITVDAGAAATLEKITVAGNITIGSGPTTLGMVNGILFAGGLAGSVCGAASNDDPLAVFKDADYKNGTISIYKGLENEYIGGAIGCIAGNIDIQNSSAQAESIYIYKRSNSSPRQYFWAGGFIGSLYGTNNNLKNCYSENPMITDLLNYTGPIYIGGFIGELNGNITYCYAKTDLIIKIGTTNNNIGGFVGLGRDGSIKFCYASGNLSLVADYGRPNFNNGGGFAGYITSCQISHSYALGDVYINSWSSSIYAGGFIGWAENNVENCFALGTVMAHCEESTAGNNIRLGGFIGNASGVIKNCVVAVHPRNLNSGMNLAATGGNNRRIGRISGTNPVSGSSNNYAWNGIKLFNDPDYDTGSPIPDTSMTVTTRVHDGKDGADASSGFFRSRSKWEDPVAGCLGYSVNVYTDINGVIANYPAWDFTGVEGRGYPRLRNEDGGIMGGQ